MTNKISLERCILSFILFFAFFVRTTSLIVFTYKNNITISENGMVAYPPNDDSQTYYHTAINLAKGKGYSITITDAPQTFPKQELPESFKLSQIPDTYYHNYYPPLYSAFLSVLYRFFGTSILVYAIPQIILGTVSCYLTYLIAKEAFSTKVGLLASFILALYHPLVWWTSYIRTETLFIFLLLVTTIFLIRAVKNNLDPKNTVFSGFFLAVLFLCRNVALYLPVFIGFYFFIVFFRTSKKRLFYCIIIFLISFYIPLLPWAYRNYTVYNHFAITTVEDWDAFYICNNVPSADVPLFSLFEQKYDYDEKDGVDLSMPTSEKEKACKSFVKKHPFKYVKLCGKRFIAFWGPITKKPSFIKKVADTIVYIIVFPMAFYGFYKSKWWTNAGVGFKPAPTLLITIILYYTLLHSLVSVDDALIYRYPIIPFICIFSAYGYYTCLKSTSSLR